jgi:hypothetical protein
MDYMEIANSPLLWLAAGLCVGLVIFQSVLFVKKSLSVSKELGIKDSQVKSAIKSSFTASVGPSLAILAGMVSLLVAMGGPISWFRLSYIGSVAFELMAAGFAADAAGVTLGGPDMTKEAFAAGVWVMTLGSFGWVLFTALFTPKLDDFRHYLAGGKKALLPIISSGAMCGAFAYLSLDRVFRFDSQTIAAIVGFVSMAAFMAYNKKKDKQWIKEWAFTISMFVGMFVSLIFI